MPDPGPEKANLLAIHLLLVQYPVLARQIRHRMRDELYRRGIISPARLDAEAHEKAALSQYREGMTDPWVQESARQWEQRLDQVRDHVTDEYFSRHLLLSLCQHIIHDLVAQRSTPPNDPAFAFNPETAPLDLLLRQAERYEALPPEDRAKIDAFYKQRYGN